MERASFKLRWAQGFNCRISDQKLRPILSEWSPTAQWALHIETAAPRAGSRAFVPHFLLKAVIALSSRYWFFPWAKISRQTRQEESCFRWNYPLY
jgi:hypothetical protein